MGNKSSGPKVPSIQLKLDAEPSDGEKDLAGTFTPMLEKSAELLASLQAYSGCDKAIRAALNDPNAETETAAWKAVTAAVGNLLTYFQWAQSMEKEFPRLLVALCGGGADQKVPNNQALVSILAKIFEFAFRFDELKMTNPAIQNDFSYYRRVLSRVKSGSSRVKDVGDSNPDLTEEVANRMSFFYAYPTPMMKILIDTSFKAEDQASKDELVNGLSLLANVSVVQLTDPATTAGARNLLYCTMSGAIILVDHLAAMGVFHKKSTVRIKQCVSTLKNSGDPATDALLNSLRFTTRHLSDDTTMPDVKKLLA
eukprot:TRINITY_DN9919_c0_g1_i1.p1 TRINITY_DN9919_c0_g1~~TRINITY_DN9919_c0_g1_i1.p1  ORF type:complete len:311 (+),score=71.91 TRINITY_DN9919_c0_g1_i1:87-1019(+)